MNEMTAAGEEYWRLWLELHDLYAQGGEADALDGMMDSAWGRMTSREVVLFRERVRNRSFRQSAELAKVPQ